MRKINWDNVQEATGFDNPIPGAYIAVICGVEDVEDKEYLKIMWDFAEGEYKGNNRDTYDRAGFWPTVLMRILQGEGTRIFQGVQDRSGVQQSRYRFDEDNLNAMIGKRICVVLGDEEYRGNDGTTKTRLYVHQTCSLQAYQKGDFKVPDLKRMNGSQAASAPSYGGGYSAPSGSFADLSDSDGELPFN